MLRANDTEDEPVSSARLDGLARAIGDIPATTPPGSRIGPFEIVRVIGEGGSSTVFEARRDVEGASQRVALKLLRQNLLSPEARRRFGREQRALIHLQHPNIARMVEGGITPDGLAYIALELVDGVPLTDFARANALGVRERLQMFATVCRAVDAAHRALIVHRDIKPSNVLVTADGEVKLLDFGIAKLLADETGPEATVLPAFTPAYAAPEQVTGDTITTATDVYALGVVLEELLTGERRQVRGTPPDAAAAARESMPRTTSRGCFSVPAPTAMFASSALPAAANVNAPRTGSYPAGAYVIVSTRAGPAGPLVATLPTLAVSASVWIVSTSPRCASTGPAVCGPSTTYTA